MKYFITYILLMTMSFAKGQIVNIPDSVFKYRLTHYTPTIDINGDGEIQNSEAASVTELIVKGDFWQAGYEYIRDLTGIRSFTSLKKLDCSDNQIKYLDISDHPTIEILYAGGYSPADSAIGTFNADNCPKLKTAIFSYSNPGFGPVVRRAKVSLKNCDSLTSVRNAGGYPIFGFDILDISNSKAIRTLVGQTQIEKLIARNCTALTDISPFGNGGATSYISSVDVTGCINLRRLEMGAEGVRVDNIDLSTCPNIKRLVVPSIFSECLYINLKNGTRMDTCDIGPVMNLTGTTSCINICIDDFETDTANWLHVLNYTFGTNVFINTYCSYYPGGAYNTIQGILRIDDNNNDCANNTGRILPNVPIKFTDSLSQNTITYSDDTGHYELYTNKGVYNFTPYFPYPYFTFNPASPTVRFDTANSIINTTNFCLQPNGVHNDLEVVFLPIGAARPGFDAGYKIIYKNTGTTTLSGTVTANFDNSKMNLISASENVTTQSTGQLTWNYNNLQPFERRTINVTFNLLPPPVNNIGDTIIYLAAITPSANDETAFDNSFILPQRVIGSFDPNDKQCLEGSKVDISKIGDYLHYLIHFQNEGTDTAFNIVVTDTLSDKLDWNTFEFVSSSHSCNPTLKNNKAEFVFENIHLPYKAIDEPGSNGWVAFKIKPKPSVVIGDSLNNSAAIYFDFNLPVITNTATTIVSSSSTPVPVKMEYFSVNQKNNTNQLNWKASCTYGNASFVIERSNDGIHFSSVGNINATSLRCQLPFNFIDNNPAAGKNYYRLKITDADGISFYSKTLVVGNNKAGIEITAVANNIIYINSNKQQRIQVKVIAGDGKEVLNEKQTVIAGTNSISLQIKNTAKGIYSLVIYTNDGEVIAKKFVK